MTGLAVLLGQADIAGGQLPGLLSNLGVVGVLVWLYVSDKAERATERKSRAEADEKAMGRYEALVDRVEAIQERADGNRREDNREMIATLKEIQANMREMSDRDRGLIKEVVQAMAEFKGIVASLETTVKALQHQVHEIRGPRRQKPEGG